MKKYDVDAKKMKETYQLPTTLFFCVYKKYLKEAHKK